MTLLNVSHHRQQQPSDCLSACAAMVLQYLSIPIRYDRLSKLLDITEYGGVFSNIKKLESLGVTVRIGMDKSDLVDGNEEKTLSHFLSTSLPLLASVETEWLNYWDVNTYHVVVVVGIEEGIVYVNDPYFDSAPISVPLNSFLAAWIEQKNLYAIIEHT